MQKNNIYFGEDARNGLMRGVELVANAVGSTMGTAGKNSLIECIESPGHYATNDGYSIINAIKFADPLEELGRSVLSEAINKANKQSGDGSSTTCVLTAAILREGMKHLSDATAMDIQRSLEKCLPLIEQSVESQKRVISVEDVGVVASVSAEDEEIGKKIQEIYQQIGKDGIIHWDVSKTATDTYSIGTGITVYGATYVSPYMCDIDETGKLSSVVRWKEPKVLLLKQKITAASDFNDLFSSLFASNIRELVIFAEDIEVPVISDLIRTRAVRGFKSVVIKIPVLWANEWWEDLSLASGATIIDGIGNKIQTATQEMLGTFGHILVTKEDTYIDGIKDISTHIANLVAEGSDGSKNRAIRLNSRTARYFVGANSESALAYRRLKVEDAINAASCALDNGVVVGGGIALYNATKELPQNEIGAIILNEALKEPLVRIVENCGAKVDMDSIGGSVGFNSKTGGVEDLVAGGIVDPTDVVLNAVRNAIGVSASILTTESIVLLPRE